MVSLKLNPQAILHSPAVPVRWVSMYRRSGRHKLRTPCILWVCYIETFLGMGRGLAGGGLPVFAYFA